MKFSSIVLSATLLITACNSDEAARTAGLQTTDSTAIAEKAQKAIQPVAKKTQPTSQDGAASSRSEVITTESANTAEAKQGWSKTAKGAVVGAVVGAGTGAVVNKRNRAVGAVIGGAAGAGAGAIIGNELDKKDGRH